MLSKWKSSARMLGVSAVLVASLCAICAPALAEQPGEAAFKAKCVMCHGADAAGKTAMGTKLNIPDLRSPQIRKLSVAELGQTITKGKNKMPAFEGKLSSGDIAQVANYIHALK